MYMAPLLGLSSAGLLSSVYGPYAWTEQRWSAQ